MGRSSPPLLASALILNAAISVSAGDVRATSLVDTLTGVPVCTAEGQQERPVIISDSAGGAIVAWEDRRSGDSYDVYVQRIDSTGGASWLPDGVAVCAGPQNQRFPKLIGDGVGGAIVAWLEERTKFVTGLLYLQRVSPEGTPLWAKKAVLVNDDVGLGEDSAELVSDGAGGAIVVWKGIQGASYAQRVNRTGALLWSLGGVRVGGAHERLAVTTDGAGGIIAANAGWAQHVDSSGALRWGERGVKVSIGENPAVATDMVGGAVATDMEGGAIVAWRQGKSPRCDVYAQRVSADGTASWGGWAVSIASYIGDQGDPNVVSDGRGGAIITWRDYGGYDSGIYARNVTASGTGKWLRGVTRVFTAGSVEARTCLVSDGAGGMIAVWPGRRVASEGETHILAQYVDSLGTVQWSPQAATLCPREGKQSHPSTATDTRGGVIVVWEDHHKGERDSDIFAQRIQLKSGSLGFR